MSPLQAYPGQPDSIRIWMIDANGNVTISPPAFALLAGITRLLVPVFANAEAAIAWGSRINVEEHATLLNLQSSAGLAVLHESNPQRKVDLAKQSHLLREAAEAFSRLSNGSGDRGRAEADLVAGH